MNTLEKNLYKCILTGLVRDKQRRKMSKSLGNSPDPFDLIEKFGADGVRVGLLLKVFLQVTTLCLKRNYVRRVYKQNMECL
jgi:valyl-tRNA synthetase